MAENTSTTTRLLLICILLLVGFQFIPNMVQFSNVKTNDWWYVHETTASSFDSSSSNTTDRQEDSEVDDEEKVRNANTTHRQEDSEVDDKGKVRNANTTHRQEDSEVDDKEKVRNANTTHRQEDSEVDDNEKVRTTEEEERGEESVIETKKGFQLYHEWSKATNASDNLDGQVETSYNLAKVLLKGGSILPKFQPHRMKYCEKTCCAESVAISIDQDEKYPVNTVSGLDLADIRIAHYTSPDELRFHASPESFLTPELVPCLQPGTIIQLDNHLKIQHYFFEMLRPNITVPYVLITSESDADSPSQITKNQLKDDLLLKWYGMNPNFKDLPTPHEKKMEPFPLGLSKHHRQSVYLTRYLEGTNFSNPFIDKSRFQKFDEKGDDLFFVSFTVDDGQRSHRKAVFDEFCKESSASTDSLSCRKDPYTLHEFYTSSSQYLFGLSPPGVGWDCYRTYEFLLLGIIPIIQRRASGTLYDDLPVIMVDNFETLTRNELVTMVQNYTSSAAFLENDFQKGWERLFLKYWRRKLLKDATYRIKMIQKGTDGRTYYQAWRYTRNEKAVYCSEAGACLS